MNNSVSVIAYLCVCFSGSSPVKIKSPLEIANMTLENRLLSYDWKNNFQHFQQATHAGSFKPLCWHSANPTPLNVSAKNFSPDFYNILPRAPPVNYCSGQSSLFLSHTARLIIYDYLFTTVLSHFCVALPNGANCATGFVLISQMCPLK
jgi:hypothetical protein